MMDQQIGRAEHRVAGVGEDDDVVVEESVDPLEEALDGDRSAGARMERLRLGRARELAIGLALDRRCEQPASYNFV